HQRNQETDHDSGIREGAHGVRSHSSTMPAGCTPSANSRSPMRTRCNECCGPNVNLPRVSSAAPPAGRFGARSPRAPFFLSDQRAIDNRPKTNVIASICLRASMLLPNLIFQTEIGNANSDGIFNDHDL